MTLKAPVHLFKMSRGRRTQSLRPAQPAGPTGDIVVQKINLRDHLANSRDAIRWDSGRIERSGAGWLYVAADDLGAGWHSRLPEGCA